MTENAEIADRLKPLLYEIKKASGALLISRFKDEFKIKDRDAEHLINQLVDAGVLNPISQSRTVLDTYFLIRLENISELSLSSEIDNNENELDEIPEIRVEPISDGIEESLVITLPESLETEELSHIQKQVNVYRQLMDMARNEILIISPFLERSGINACRKEFNNAAMRGVTIKLITRLPDESSISRKLGLMDLQAIFESKKASDKLSIRTFHRFSGSYIEYGVHAKIIVADGKVGYVGSGEIRSNSFFVLVEIGKIIKGLDIQQLVMIFNTLWENSEILPETI